MGKARQIQNHKYFTLLNYNLDCSLFERHVKMVPPHHLILVIYVKIWKKSLLLQPINCRAIWLYFFDKIIISLFKSLKSLKLLCLLSQKMFNCFEYTVTSHCGLGGRAASQTSTRSSLILLGLRGYCIMKMSNYRESVGQCSSFPSKHRGPTNIYNTCHLVYSFDFVYPI